MNENCELLLYIYENIDMGVKSCTKLIRLLNNRDNKIKKIVEGELKGYEELLQRVNVLMKKFKVSKKTKGVISDIGLSLGMSMEFMMDNSDARIADMLTKGFMMGNVDISKKIDMYKADADSKILDLAKDLLAFGKSNIELLKAYL